jgi:hypothetical protein
MSEEKVKAIIKVVSDALGEDVKYFDIEKSEVLDEEENYISATVCVSPKKDISLPSDHILKCGKCYLQIDHFDDEFNLMVGEDGDVELDVTYGNIYAQLFWDRAIHEI